MKKTISLFLAILMIFAAVVPAFAAINDYPRNKIKYPVIYIHGNAGSIVDADENRVYNVDTTSEQIVDMCKKVLPKLAKGLVTNNFDEYYDAFEEEFAKLYDKCSLDKEGNPKYGTREEKSARERTERDRHSNYINNGGYDLDYTFCLDWRLDPLYNADLLDAYIDDVMQATGKDKVCLVSDCLGSVNILAYLGKYGHGKLYGIGMLDPVGFGCELVEDTFSGHIDLDPDAIEKFVNDKFIDTVLPADFTTIFEFIRTSVELANETGLLDGFSELFMRGLYDRLKDELVPRLTMASYGSFLSYWGLITAGRYDETKNFIFGQPGSERYDEYSVFIEKLDEYDRLVRQRIPELLTSAKEDGVKLAIVAKYGVQFPCVLESADKQCDVWVSLNYSTLGATCAPIGETLSDEYIAEREALGYGKYISPDRIVDMSTCLLPDNTWVQKNRIHNQAGIDNDFFRNVFAEDNITVDNSFAPQFTVYSDETNAMEIMTEENCHTETWYTEPVESRGLLGDIFAKVAAFSAKIKLWFTQLFGLMEMLDDTGNGQATGTE